MLYAVPLNHTLYIIALVGQACYGLVGMLWRGYGLYRYNRSIRQWSSYTEGIEVGWVFRILVSFMVLYVVWTLASSASAIRSMQWPPMPCCVPT